MRRAYLLVHTPVNLRRPVPLGFVYKCKWSDAQFKEFADDTLQESCTYLTKKSIERWGFLPPPGARVQVLEVEVPSEEWFNNWQLATKEMK